MTIKWTSAARTDVGKSRKLNEDSLLDRGDIGLWVVADGMGGHSAGDVASQMIVNELNKLTAPDNLETFTDSAEDVLLEVNNRLVDMALEAGDNSTIGSTVIALLAYGEYCLYMWAGDSRCYRLRDNKMDRMSQDHSQAEVYISQGLMTAEEAAVHPAANMVTRAIGATKELRVDMDLEPLRAGDRYMLCSDGVDKHISDLEVEIIMKEGDADTVVNALIELTLERGAMDNTTVIVIDFVAA